LNKINFGSKLVSIEHKSQTVNVEISEEKLSPNFGRSQVND